MLVRKPSGWKQLNLPVEQMNSLILQKCFYSLTVNVDVNWILMIILILILELIFILGMYHICAIRPYGHSDIYSGANINVQVCPIIKKSMFRYVQEHAATLGAAAIAVTCLMVNI